MFDLYFSVNKFFRFLLILLVLFPVAALAQEDQPELTISLRRDFGYGGFGIDIQGLFTIRTTGPDNLEKVSFYLDDQLMAEVSQAPFNYQFRTDDYGLGQHTISAVGITSDGTTLRSNQVPVRFVAPEVGRNTTVTLVLIVLGLVAGAMLISGLVTTLTRRGRKETGTVPVSYGALGGVVCSHCYKPYSRHWWGINLIAGKLDRCPHCGKWSLTRRATPDELRLAEEIIRQQEIPEEIEKSPDEREKDYQRELDESKYMD